MNMVFRKHFTTEYTYMFMRKLYFCCALVMKVNVNCLFFVVSMKKKISIKFIWIFTTYRNCFLSSDEMNDTLVMEQIFK